jgi:hypothetical protein
MILFTEGVVVLSSREVVLVVSEVGALDVFADANAFVRCFKKSSNVLVR